jgi:hypothetical protein
MTFCGLNRATDAGDWLKFKNPEAAGSEERRKRIGADYLNA